MKAYKGFNKDMTCRGFQFEEGKTYEESKAKLCDCGFHACEYPLDCFRYYSPNSSIYHEVDLEGVDKDSKSTDSKVASRKITIGGNLSIKGLVDASIQYIMEHIDNTKIQTVTGSAASNMGDRSAASNTGYCSAASNTGYCSAASNTGYCSAASNTGYRSAASNTGYCSAASNTGDYSAASNMGDRSAASNTGDYSAASNTGDYSAASNTGYRSAASNTGDCSAASSTGYCSAASVSGKQSVALAIGYGSKVKGAIGCWIVVSEWTKMPEGNYQIVDVQCRKVDGETIKPDTWYMLKNGEFVEAE